MSSPTQAEANQEDAEMNGNDRAGQQYQWAEKDVVVDHLEDHVDPGQPLDIPTPAVKT